MALSIRDIVTVQLLKDTYVQGVDLTLDNGDPYPDVLFESAIDQAIAMVEKELEITLDPTIIEGERHDADAIDANALWPIPLDTKPLREVTGLQLQLGNNSPATLPLDWVTVSTYAQASIKIIPTSTSYGVISFNSGVPMLIGDVFSPYRKFADYFKLSYVAGFTFEEGSFIIPAGQTQLRVNFQENFRDTKPNITFNNATVRVRIAGPSYMDISIPAALPGPLTVTYSANNVDPLIIKAILLIASMLPLNIAGDLIAGAGVASQSLSIDGLSQSINTTASATSAGYGARIIQYSKELAGIMATLRSEYGRVNFWAR